LREAPFSKGVLSIISIKLLYKYHGYLSVFRYEEGVKKNETVLIELFCFHVYNIHHFFVNYRIAK